MAGHHPNYALYIDEEENHDEAHQLIDNLDGVIEVVDEENRDQNHQLIDDHDGVIEVVDEENRDQTHQLIDDHDGVIEVVDEESEEDEDESEEDEVESEEDEEDESGEDESEEDDEDDDNDDDDDEDEDEAEDEDEDEDVEFNPVVMNQGSENVVEDDEGMPNGSRISLCNGKVGSEENEVGGEWNRSEIDGLFCPICMDAWTNGGDHQVCCLPCGHIYGLSCIKKWIQRRQSSGKCPQCNRKCTLKGVRILYASRVMAVDEELQKKVRSLEAKCASLEKQSREMLYQEMLTNRAMIEDLKRYMDERFAMTERDIRALTEANARMSGVGPSAEPHK